MKIILTVLFLLLSVVGSIAAESANEIAVSIIRSDFAPAYNVKDNSHEEAVAAANVNSILSLNTFMTSNQVSEEIRICYALRIIREKLGIAQAIKSSTAILPDEKALLEKRRILAERLLELTKK